MSEAALIDTLRGLIVRAAPDEARAAPVLGLDPDAPLNAAMAASSPTRGR